jgi:putative DNA primase/helicase
VNDAPPSVISIEEARALAEQAQAASMNDDLAEVEAPSGLLAPMIGEVKRPEESIPGHRALTQLGNAERMVDRFSDRFRYCAPLGHFFVWDGRRWREDFEGHAIRKLAAATVRSIYEEVSDDRDLATAEREMLTKHAVKSETDRSIDGMVKLVRSLPGVAVEPELFDRDPYLFNVRNGTIELRTGKLRPHRREDFITQLAPVRYDERAEAPLFIAFLKRIFSDDLELIDFVQRLLGYCLTGECTEQAMAVCYGPTGKNGKSTLLTAVLNVLGSDYAIELPASFFLAKKWEAHPEEVARLRGRRYACAVEVNEGAKLDEARVKHLTGNDRIAARHMYEGTFDFAPSHKFLIGVNERPEVQGMDDAIWRRLLLVPFTVQIPEAERDLDFGKKLLKEAPGMLAWMVRGCLAWQRQHLAPPATVVAASKEYRDEMDTVRSFLQSDRCKLSPGFATPKGRLRAAYEEWCQAEGMQPQRPRTWAAQLRKLKLKEDEIGHGNVARWLGVTLVAADVSGGND